MCRGDFYFVIKSIMRTFLLICAFADKINKKACFFLYSVRIMKDKS